MITWPDLRPVLRGIPWAIVGGVATRAYMPERETKDLDILVRHDDGDEVRERMEAAGYKFVTPLALPGFTVCSPDGVEIDIILGDYPWLHEALIHPRYDPAGLPVLDLPYLVMMKIDASRGRDIGDLTTMLGLASDETLEQVRAVAALHAPDVVDDLESLIYLGQVEMRDVMRKT